MGELPDLPGEHSDVPERRDRPKRDWIQIVVTALPGLAAIVALIFTLRATNDQLQETRQQLQINGQGQITDRFNVAVTNLGASSVVIRLGGIYALQRIMRDSPRVAIHQASAA
jgi:hypothetical protein